MSRHRLLYQMSASAAKFAGMAVPYSARRQALRRGAAATPVAAEPTAAELEQAGQWYYHLIKPCAYNLLL